MRILRFTALAVLFANSIALAHPPDWKADAERRLAALDEKIAKLGGTGSAFVSTDAGWTDATIGSRAPGREEVTIKAKLSRDPAKAKEEFEDTFAPYWENGGTAERFEAGGARAKIYSRVDAEPGETYLSRLPAGAAIGETLVGGDLVIRVMCIRVGKTPSEDPSGAFSSDEAVTLREAAAARVRELLGELAGVKPEKPKDADPFRLDVIDAYGGGFNDLPEHLQHTFWRRRLSAAVQIAHRRGAAADGASLLYLRVKCPGAGKAVFSLSSDGPAGTLHGFDEDPFKTAGAATVDTEAANLDAVILPEKRIPAIKGYFALAQWKPPRDFGRGYGAREFKVSVVFAPEGGGEPLRAERPLVLVRPPLVLVHGTYDNPKDCWKTTLEGTGGKTMAERLAQEGFRTFLADWEETNGNKDPSSFEHNRDRVYMAPGGISEALEAFRKDELAATRADLVCHSQGGVIARVYAATPAYRREENFWQGDINRLITISSTHMGSDICRLFDAYMTYQGAHQNWPALWTGIFLGYVHYGEQGIYTDGFRDQVPGSPALRAIPATPVRAHAIACAAADEDLHSAGGLYRDRMMKVWMGSKPEVLEYAFKKLGQEADGKRLASMKAEEDALEARIQAALPTKSYPAVPENPAVAELGAEYADLQLAHSLVFRDAVFAHERNDCTVRESSSKGGLAPPYATTIEHVLHGFAPRYASVQSRVVELLTSEGDGSFAQGFPKAYP